MVAVVAAASNIAVTAAVTVVMLRLVVFLNTPLIMPVADSILMASAIVTTSTSLLSPSFAAPSPVLSGRIWRSSTLIRACSNSKSKAFPDKV